VKGSVEPHGKGFRYIFNGRPDPLTGERNKIQQGGFENDREAWAACHKAMAEYEAETYVKPSNRTVQQLIEEWLTRRQHKIKPSMLANYRNYANYYVYPYIGKRAATDLDSAVFDALYDRLLTSGRVKAQRSARTATAQAEAARRAQRIADKAAGKKLRGPTPKPRPAPVLDPGLGPKTVVNVHRMLHKAWADATVWRYVKRNVVAEANPPRVPRTKKQTWSVDQIQRFLTFAKEDRFFALWVLELTTGMRRCELAGADRDGVNETEGTLDLYDTRVVIDGKVIESDGKSAGSFHTIALDPLTLRLLLEHIAVIKTEKDAFAADYQDHGKLFCWPNGTLPHPDTITRRFQAIARRAALPVIDLHEARHSYVTAGRRVKADPKAMSRRVGHASVAFTMETYMHDDIEADRTLAEQMARLILPGALGAGDGEGGENDPD
jgi:site-specific recombinase XerC